MAAANAKRWFVEVRAWSGERSGPKFRRLGPFDTEHMAWYNKGKADASMVDGKDCFSIVVSEPA